MFRFMQEPSSGSSPVLHYNYQFGLSVLVGIDVVNVMAAYQPVVQAYGEPHACTTGWFAQPAMPLYVPTLVHILGVIPR
jgi:hypothetical protein